MNMMEQLQHEAETLGIALSHYDIDGQLIYANPESVAYFTQVLRSTGGGTRGNGERFDDVIVAQESEPITYDTSTLNLPQCAAIHIAIIDENGQSVFEQTSSLTSILSLPPLSFGYYSLILVAAKQQYRLRLLVSPSTVYQPPVFAQKKAWGLNVQVYSLRSERNWGIGDFADLAYLAKSAVKFGADFIGINPLHLLYPSVPEWASPYSSSSRRWLNYLYLAIDQLPEFKLCKSVQSWFTTEEIQQQLNALRASELVDYSSVHQLKIRALEKLFDFFKRSKSAKINARREAFAAFVRGEGEDLLLQGLFNVLDSLEHDKMPEDENQIGWLGWRQEWQQLSIEQRDALLTQHQEKVMFYAWLQWITAVQLAELQADCLTSGMALGLYGDLAVSSSRGSVDVWSDPSLYCVNVSVGAPPDPLGPVGQNWNIPPYNATELKARGFQPFIEMLRANMRHFGVLRIDHIMGLFRLWLIPEGKTASDGLYVRCAFEALMAVLAIESQRHRCLIIGEDLGTVPDEVRSKLNALSIFSYFVLYFEQREQQFPNNQAFPLKAFATIGTHDVPSLASFWHCRDLQLFADLGILSVDFLRQKYDQRVIDKQAILNTLHRDHYLPPDYAGDALSMAMHDHLNDMIHQYVAESRTQLIGVQLENLLNQEVSFNLPGTSTEYPNWRKKLPYTLEGLFSNDYIPSFLTRINSARHK